MSRARIVAVSALVLLAATACASDGPVEPVAGATSTTAPSDPSTSATTGAPPDTVPEEQATDPDPVPGQPRVTIQPVDLADLAPVAALTDVLAAPDGSGLWLVEQRGLIRRTGGGDQVVLDVTDRTTADGERGLLGAVLIDDGRRLVVDYTSSATGDTVIEMFDIAADGAVDPDTGIRLLTIGQPFANHNGGDLEALPDGTILIATGDGGSAGDPRRVAQRLDDPLGKILRLRPGTDPTRLVPVDNPWVGAPDADPLVWASGLRNPWRIDVDPLTGDLWVADVGQAALEEVSLAEAGGAVAGGAGADFGWSAREGDDAYNSDVAPDPRAIPVDPIHTYPHADGECSITGGVVYRGTAIPDLWGWYVFADHCSGRVRALDRRRNEIVELGVVERPTAIERGPGGEVFVATGGGEVFSVGRP